MDTRKYNEADMTWMNTFKEVEPEEVKEELASSMKKLARGEIDECILHSPESPVMKARRRKKRKDQRKARRINRKKK